MYKLCNTGMYMYMYMYVQKIQISTTDINPLGCVQNHIQIGGFGTVRVN